jgi:hypothetical protein
VLGCGLAYPHVFGRQSIARKTYRKALRGRGVVTGETCESLGEQAGHRKPIPSGVGGFTRVMRLLGVRYSRTVPTMTSIRDVAESAGVLSSAGINGTVSALGTKVD